MKTCSKCGLNKTEEEFNRIRANEDRRSSKCKPCSNSECAEWKRNDTAEKKEARKELKKAEKLLAEKGLKKCPLCGEIKSLDEYHRANTRKKGVQDACKPCTAARASTYYKANPGRYVEQAKNYRKGKEPLQKARNRRRRLKNYGLEPEDFEQLRMNQQNKCAICKKEFVKIPLIDHCHNTGKIRGLLCTKCNTGIGQLGDSAELCIAAAAYLQKDALTPHPK